MSKSNILKHLRPPEGVDKDLWEKRLLLHMEHKRSVAYALYFIYTEHADKALEDLCDRCEELLAACEAAHDSMRIAVEAGLFGFSAEQTKQIVDDHVVVKMLREAIANAKGTQ